MTIELLGPALIFWFLAIVAVGAAVMVVASKSPVHSALFLLLTFAIVAGLFILQGAEFIGAVQILVYAGGIMVLFLFVIMLVNIEEAEAQSAFHPGSRMAVVLGALLLALVGWGMIHSGAPTDKAALDTLSKVPSDLSAFSAAGKEGSNSRAVGYLLYGRYLVPFEVASILLLVAMIGAIVMGKQRVEADHVEDPQP